MTDRERVILFADIRHHLAGHTVCRRTNSLSADAHRILDVLARRDVRSTSLADVQLNRTDLAAELVLHGDLKRLARARELLVAECVHARNTDALANVRAVREVDALGDRDHNVRLLLELLPYVLEEFLHREIPLGEINEIGLNAVHNATDRRGSRQPARVTAHNLNDRDRLRRVDRTVTDDLLHRYGNVLCRRAEAGGVVGADEVVVDRLRNAHNAHLVVAGLRVCRQLCDRVHRVVAADVEEIADVILLEDREELLENALGILPYLRELLTAGAERRRRGVLEHIDALIVRKRLAEIDQTLLKETLNAVAHTVQRLDRTVVYVFLHTADDTRKRRVDRRSRATRLTDDRITNEFFHRCILSPIRESKIFSKLQYTTISRSCQQNFQPCGKLYGKPSARLYHTHIKHEGEPRASRHGLTLLFYTHKGLSFIAIFNLCIAGKRSMYV